MSKLQQTKGGTFFETQCSGSSSSSSAVRFTLIEGQFSTWIWVSQLPSEFLDLTVLEMR